MSQLPQDLPVDAAVLEAKRALRTRMRARRHARPAGAVAAEREGWTAGAAAVTALAPGARCVASYLPAPGEPDPLGAMHAWHGAGMRVMVPVSGSRRSLRWVVWTPDTPVRTGTLVPVPEPVDAPPADPAEIDLVVVPALAVAADGRRLGQGGGYYDTFLARRAVPTVACIRDEELLEAVPWDAWDAVLHAAWTPKGVEPLPRT